MEIKPLKEGGIEKKIESAQYDVYGKVRDGCIGRHNMRKKTILLL